MKIQGIIVASFLILFAALSAQAQTAFTNLNFEQARPNPDTPGSVTAVSALPHWTASIDGVQQTEVEYDEISGGAASVALVSAAIPYYPAIDGNYSVLLQAYPPGSVVSISQTDLIPAGSQSLLFEANRDTAAFELFVGTQIVPFSAVGSGPNYTLYGANISAWADDTEEIAFTVLGGSPNNNWELDDISFSAVPEPSIMGLSAIAGLLFSARKWFARR